VTIMDAPTEGGLSRRGFLGLLAAGAGIGVAAGYGISQGFGTSNSTAVDLSRKTVYLTNSYGDVYALHASTGAVRWARPLNTSDVLVGNSRLYADSYDGYMYALDAGTGQIDWTHRIGSRGNVGAVTGLVSLYPSVSGDIVYIAASDGYTYALNAATGHLQWRHQTTGYSSQSPVVYRGIVYVGSPDAYVYALDAKSGRFRWRFGEGGQAYTGLLVVAQNMVFAEGAAHLYALDPRSGKVRGIYPPALPSSNGIVYTGTATGSLQARDILRSRILWTYQAKNVQWLPATIAGNTLYIGANNLGSCCAGSSAASGAAVALDAATGKSIWIYTAPEPISTAPVITDGIVYVLGQWNLYALDAETGEGRWIYTTSRGIGSTVAVG